jgi:hypothetical protein
VIDAGISHGGVGLEVDGMVPWLVFRETMGGFFAEDLVVTLKLGRDVILRWFGGIATLVDMVVFPIVSLFELQAQTSRM